MNEEELKQVRDIVRSISHTFPRPSFTVVILFTYVSPAYVNFGQCYIELDYRVTKNKYVGWI